MADKPLFVVATPGHSQMDEDKARILASRGLLRCVAKGTRRGTAGVPAELTRLNPKIGLVFTAAAFMLRDFKAESVRFRLNPWFDRWVKKQLRPGDHIISSYGYTNESFKWARRHGGKTLLTAGNSHPENFWNTLEPEYRRWNCSDPPVDRRHYERSVAMMAETDYVLSPSSWVTNSFLSRGFKPEQILTDLYPVDLTCFTPPKVPREKNRSLTIISTGGLSLRKGCPYMLEAFRLVLKQHPTARFRLIRRIQDSAVPILEKYRDLPIDWSPGLPHAQLADWLRGSDIFVLPSLEEGLVRTALEALACGLPAILTPNTGSADYVQPGINGEIVPVRDAQAIANALLKWADLILSPNGKPPIPFDASVLSFETFERNFLAQLKSRGLA